MSDKSDELQKLKTNLKSIDAIYMVIVGIFAVIIVAWIVLGIWRSNVMLFTSTIAMAVTVSASLFAARNAIRQKMKKHESNE